MPDHRIEVPPGNLAKQEPPPPPTAQQLEARQRAALYHELSYLLSSYELPGLQLFYEIDGKRYRVRDERNPSPQMELPF